MRCESGVRIIVCAITVFFACLSPAAVCAELSLADIIENVRQSESLYADIEVVIQTTYDYDAAADGVVDPDIVVRSDSRTRYISQGQWFRVERLGRSKMSNHGTSLDRVRAFDGETTRVLEQNSIGNISRERLEDENFIRPHMLLIRNTRLFVPLSVYLSGHDAIRAHPNGRGWQTALTMEVSYEGVESRHGLDCHKVVVVVLNHGEPHDSRVFWLAEARNYLPIEELAFTYRTSKDIPLGSATASDLREVAPGVWFPFDVLITTYDSNLIEREGRQSLIWQERFVVEKVDLNPKYDRALFSQVEFPDGVAMYEVSHGEIKRSWRQGAVSADEQPAPGRALLKWWILWVNVVLIGIALIGSQVVRRWRRK